jgi:serine/threonine-protein kinase
MEAGHGSMMGLTFSPEGDRIAFAGVGAAGYSGGQETPKIWVHDLVLGTTESLLDSGSGDYWPIWDPDGRSVVFTTARSGEGFDLYRAAVDGSGEHGAVYTDSAIKNAHSWLPDGTGLIFQSQPGFESDFDIWLLPMEDGVSPRPLVEGPGNEVHPSLSPDGRWLLYESDETGRNEVYVQSFPNVDDGKWAVSNRGGVMPYWAHGGGEIFYVDAEGRMTAATVETEPAFRVTERTILFEMPLDILFRQTEQYTLYEVAPDDDRFLMIRNAGTVEPDMELIFVQNWIGELEGR